MTMIPTYVTKVPNGTEEVRSLTADSNPCISVPIISISNTLPWDIGCIPCRRPWWYQLSCLFRDPERRHHIHHCAIKDCHPTVSHDLGL